MRIYVRVFLLSLVLAFLTGCATHQQFVDNRFTLPDKIEPEQGIVVLKIIGVQPLSLFNAKWQTLRLTNKASGQSLSLEDTAQPFASYSLFMGALPNGQYEISDLESVGPTPAGFGILPLLIIGALTSDNQSVGHKLGSFTIKSETLTNLGTVVSALPAEKGGQPKLAVLADHAGQSAALADVTPTAKARIAKLNALGWDNPPNTDASARALDIIRTSNSNISAIESTPDGRIIAGSVLGMLHSRSPEGKWTSQSVGGFDTIIYVRALANGRIFAGTDNGKYFLWLPDQKRWVEHRVTNEDFKVTHVEPMGEIGFAIQAASTHQPTLSNPIKTRILFKAKLEDAAEASEMLSIDGFSAFTKLVTFFTGDELLVFFNQVGFSRVADRYRVNPVSFAKTQDIVPYWAADMYRLPDNTLVLNRMNGLSIYNSFSTDNGKTWIDNENSGPNAMRYIDTNTGYGFSHVSTGWSTVTVTLSKTQDGGKTWQAVGTPIDVAGALPIRILGKRLFVFTGQKVLSTVDEGGTWDTEWPLAANNTSAKLGD